MIIEQMKEGFENGVEISLRIYITTKITTTKDYSWDIRVSTSKDDKDKSFHYED